MEQDGAAALIEALVLAPEPEARRNAARLEEAARARHDELRASGAVAAVAGSGDRRMTGLPPIVPDDEASRARAAELLRAGRIVAVPTDTVYGIAAWLELPDAIERLFAAKRRPPEKAVAVLLADVAQAWTLGIETPAARVLGERFWPGGLTLVLPVRPDAVLPTVLAAGTPTIGVRVPDHAVAACAGRGARSAADDLGQRVRRA